MTGGGVLCSYFVLDTLFHLGYTLAHPGPTGGALARRRKSGAGSGPAAGLASLLAGGPWQPCAGPSPPKSTACEAPSGSSHSTILDQPSGSEPIGSGPTGAGICSMTPLHIRQGPAECLRQGFTLRRRQV